MPNTDLHAAVTSWVAQELEASASKDGIGYWVSLLTDKRSPEQWPWAAILIAGDGFFNCGRVGWPLPEEAVRQEVRAILGRMGLLGGRS